MNTTISSQCGDLKLMKTIEYHDIDKSGWPDGPWKFEPDKVQYMDEETGLPCLIFRNGFGALCGYVGTSENHLQFKKDSDDIEVADINVHGGITFTDFCKKGGICHIPDENEPDHVWWLGFDCIHSGDYYPTSTYPRRSSETYKDINYVKNEIKNLCKQIITSNST